MIEEEDRILNNFRTYPLSPLNNFKHSDLNNQTKFHAKHYKEPIKIQSEILKIHEDSISADRSKSKDDNSEEIQGNLRRSARVPKMSAKLLQYLTEHPDTQESLIPPDSNTQ